MEASECLKCDNISLNCNVYIQVTCTLIKTIFSCLYYFFIFANICVLWQHTLWCIQFPVNSPELCIQPSLSGSGLCPSAVKTWLSAGLHPLQQTRYLHRGTTHSIITELHWYGSVKSVRSSQVRQKKTCHSLSLKENYKNHGLCLTHECKPRSKSISVSVWWTLGEAAGREQHAQLCPSDDIMFKKRIK